MQPSADEAALALQAIERQRRVVRRSFPGRPRVWISLVGMVAFGVVQDLAPTWSGVAFLVFGVIAVSIGLWGSTRWGATMLGDRVKPRAFAQGGGVRLPPLARRLLVYGGLAAVAFAFGAFMAHEVTHSSPSNGAWWPADWPHTVEMLAIWAVVWLGFVVSRRRLTQDSGKS
jgi:hypothetical protein